jgi:hypothetical protein
MVGTVRRTDRFDRSKGVFVMTRVFLAAGVAALAIAAPAYAGPHGGGKDRQATVNQSSGDQRAQRQQARATRQQAAPRIERQQMRAARVERQAPRVERQQMRAARVERQAPRIERQQARIERQARPARVERQQVRVERQQARVERQARPARVERQQARVERQQVRENRAQQVQTRQAERQQIRANAQTQTQVAGREQLRAERINARQTRVAARSNLLAERQALRADRIANADAFRTSRIAALTTSPVVRTRVLDPVQAVRFVGEPVNVVSNTVPLMVLPTTVSYLYPDTPDYYYRYGGGYLYQVDRSSSLIAALIPLLAGGFMPGTYLPNYYMNSYVPNYYGLNSFYPSSYSGYDYGYGYDNLCNRYANGVIYRVDCYTGMIVDVVPMYAGGYGVGQMLPSAYSYYNVPYQYRDLYYDTSDYGYWYAPGAIYQYDPRSSLITSVAALMSPGFSVGQPLPMGYDVYNVPYAYRSTYYDTPNAWYRYNNGYIYQVDPTTQLVSAIVASVLRA